MPVNLSIKNAPDDIVERLRKRARRNRRSLQGELLVIIEDATRLEETISLHEVTERNRAMGLRTPDQAVQMIREDRDRRRFNINDMPDIDLGPWPNAVRLRREDIYGGEGR